MGRSPLFRHVQRAAAIARFADHHRVSTAEAMERVAALRAHRAAEKAVALDPSRRGVLQGMGALGAAGLAAMATPRAGRAAPVSRTTARIAVIGGGMAGLSAAYKLYGKGVLADVFEARSRSGGRVFSLGGAFPGDVTFPGQVVERGGELIDTLHTTMRGYATEFGLTLEDYDKDPGEPVFWSDGQAWDEADVVDEYRDFTATMRADLQTLSPPTALDHTAADEALDYTSLEEYLDTRGAGSLLRDILTSAYVGEYGAELSDQSSLNLLLFIHADNSSRFREFGVYSDERFHVVGGNEQIPAAIADVLGDQIQYGMKLVAMSKTSAGAYALTFEDDGGGTTTVDYDYVVMAIPFSVLRHVSIDASVGMPGWKTDLIANYGYGTNSKMMIGFDGRPWADAGSNGGVYARGLPNIVNVWETNAENATATRGVLTNYSGGTLGAGYDESNVQGEAAAFLADFEQIFPGASAQVTRDSSGLLRVHLEKWSASPFNQGSYTNNRPGYYTTMCELEAIPVDRIFFAGEHTDSFYEWQGFMEGAANSGIAAATEILAELRVP